MVITLLQNCCVRIITNVEAQHEIVDATETKQRKICDRGINNDDK